MKRMIITSVLVGLLGLSAYADNAAPKPADKAAAPDAKAAAKPTEPLLAPGRPGLAVNTNKVVFTNLYMKASYVLGVQNAATLVIDGADLLVPEMVILGMRDVFEKRMPLVAQDEADEILQKYSKAVQEAEADKKKKEAADNKARGEKFLEENAKKEGVKVTESGLQYKVVSTGDGKGASPTEDDKVAIHFRARNVDGHEFANSYKHKAPVVATLRSQVKALREAVPMMKEGDKWELYIPSELAWGNREAAKGIGPNSMVIFEVELVRVEKTNPAEAKK